MARRARTMEEHYRDQERRSPLETRVRLAGIPAKYRDLTWSDYRDSARTRTESLRDILMSFAAHWEPGSEGLVVLGQPGRGKTFGVALAALEVVEAKGWVRWVSYADLAEQMRALVRLSREAERTDDWSDHDRAEMRLRWVREDCELLVLDDVGKEYRSKSGYSDAELDRLLRGRVAASKTTVLTSNIPLPDWRQYSESMASFLAEVGEVVALVDGEDQRGRTEPAGRRRRRAQG